ncbi:hypothetical protein [Parasedimentitalea psychrophila]|uniref:Mucin n=1 Tax=Parasedimentitalea psychrophila TaxID=2997337 RepID=A0A9Y2KX29_9RHOB|nr:hypothetical protein [Parasedimentitalea psychrophila]WIY24268.1 hypothetical protein QPJ95_16935 [Parasedimentitalea psychrophila]
MSKTIISVILAVCVGAALFFWFTKPEPTPGERLSEAVATAGDALQDAGEAISDSAAESAEQITSDVQAAAADIAEDVTAQATAFSNEAARIIAAWDETDILSADGYSHDNAVKAIKTSTLDDETKDQILALLQQIKDAPETLEQKAAEIREILTK